MDTKKNANGQTPAQRATYNRAYYSRPENAEKRRARDAINNRIYSGTLIRQPCEACQAEPAQAHHDDYSKPLDIRWLCGKCHKATHREMERAQVTLPHSSELRE